MGPEAPDWTGQIEATAPETALRRRRRRARLGLQGRDKNGTGGSRAAGPGPPAQPHVQDELLPTQGTRQDRGAQPGTAGKEGRATGTLRHPGLGLPLRRSRQGKLTFPQHPGPKPDFLKPFALRTPEEFKDRSAAERLHLCSFHWGRPKAAAPEPTAVPSPCPRHCPGASLLSRDGKRLPNGRTRHTPALGTGTARPMLGTGWRQSRRCSGPHELAEFVPSSRLILAARSVPAFQDTQAHVASDVSPTIQLNPRDTQAPKIPAGGGPGCSRKVELPRQKTELWVN